MISLLQDLRYSLRTLLKSPSFTIVAVLALALGIGANAAIFSVVNGVLIKPLPYGNQDRLVRVFAQFLGQDMPKSNMSPPEFFDFKGRNRVFDEIAAYADWKVNLTGVQDPERLPSTYATAGLWRILGVPAALGRTFTDQEDQKGHDTVVVLSHDLWQKRFGSDPKIVGKLLTLGGHPYEVVGVMPQGFHFPSKEAQLWLPFGFDPANPGERSAHYVSVLARLKPGVSLQQAQGEVSAIARQIQAENQKNGFYPAASGWGALVLPLKEDIVGEIRSALFVLLGAVSFVLLIACANVANLLLVRADVRQREIGIRAALGAGRGQIFRQLLTESVLLGLAGAVLGLILASWSIHLVLALNPPNIPRLDEVSALEPRVIGFTFLLALLTSILFGLLPALQTSKVSFQETLKEGSRGTTRRAGLYVRRFLVASEIGLSLVLLIGAGLLIRSFMRLQQVDLGFKPDHLLTVQVTPPRTKYPGDELLVLYNQFLQQTRAMPGVQSAALVSQVPLGDMKWTGNFEIEGRPLGPNDVPPEVSWRSVSPGYLETLKIPVLQGRSFTPQDGIVTPTTSSLAVIDQAMARHYFPQESPIGKRLILGSAKAADADTRWLTIIGVVGNAKQEGPGAEERPVIYVNYVEHVPMSLVVRSTGDPELLASPIRTTLRNLDPDVPTSQLMTMDQRIHDSMSRPRFNLMLLSLLASIALVLAVIGIYGVLSYTVHQQSHEIGIRMALGADRGTVRSMVVGHGMKLTALGLIAGIVTALALTRLMSSLLFGVSSTDLTTFAGVPVLLAVVALAASYFPARRATQVAPMVALREE
ncbi:MAG TPA: ABC transporter permease [Thermoanaerobaculia bacterium]